MELEAMNEVVAGAAIEVEDDIDEATQLKYRIWKKNAPFLYDYLSTNTLLWPSLNVLFFPDMTKNPQSKDEHEATCSQRLLHGSFTLGQQIDSISIVQLTYFENLNKSVKLNKLEYNHDKEEFQLSTTSPVNKLKLLQKINQLGDVNQVKYMPQNPNILALANNLGDLVIFERTKHSSFKNKISDLEVNKAQLRLQGGQKGVKLDIFAIDWNPQREGQLVSGNMDGDVNIFNVREDYSSKESAMKESQYFDIGHGINDIEWFSNHLDLFSLADESGRLRVFDIRKQNPIVKDLKASTIGVNSQSINPGNSTCIATGDGNGVVKIWDLRSDSAYSEFKEHTDSITQLKWNPVFHNILGSSSTDKLVNILDVEEHKLIFTHAGHMLGVNDFDWSHHDAWLVASVADDNSLHVWRAGNDVTGRYTASR